MASFFTETMPRIRNILRTQDDANRHFVYMLTGFASSAAALVWIYRRGIQSQPWLGQGIRFGVAVWMLTSLPWFLTYYAVQPWPRGGGGQANFI